MISSAACAVARWIGPFLVAAAVVGLGVSAAALGGPAPAVRLAADDANPLAGQALYVDPNSAAMRAARSADPPNPQLDVNANTPQAYWIDNRVPADAVTRYIGNQRITTSAPWWRYRRAYQRNVY